MPKKDIKKGKSASIEVAPQLDSSGLRRLNALTQRSLEDGGPISIEFVAVPLLHEGEMNQSVIDLLRDEDTLIIVPEIYGGFDYEKVLNGIAQKGFSLDKIDPESEAAQSTIEFSRSLYFGIGGAKKRILLFDIQAQSTEEDKKIDAETRITQKETSDFFTSTEKLPISDPARKNAITKIKQMLANNFANVAKTNNLREQHMIEQLYARAGDMADEIIARGVTTARVVFLVGNAHEPFIQALEAQCSPQGNLSRIAFRRQEDSDKEYDYPISNHSRTLIDLMRTRALKTSSEEDTQLLFKALAYTVIYNLLNPQVSEEKKGFKSPIQFNRLTTRNQAGLFIQFVTAMTETFTIEEIYNLLITQRETTPIMETFPPIILDRMDRQLRREQYADLHNLFDKMVEQGMLPK